MWRNVARLLLIAVIVAAAYHLFRDLLQLVSMDSSLTDVLHRRHQWCGAYCDSVTLPLDILGITVPLVALLQNKLRIGFAIVSVIVLISLLFMLLP